MINEVAEREAFERWRGRKLSASQRERFLARDGLDDDAPYVHRGTRAMWFGWVARATAHNNHRGIEAVPLGECFDCGTDCARCGHPEQILREGVPAPIVIATTAKDNRANGGLTTFDTPVTVGAGQELVIVEREPDPDERRGAPA